MPTVHRFRYSESEPLAAFFAALAAFFSSFARFFLACSSSSSSLSCFRFFDEPSWE